MAKKPNSADSAAREAGMPADKVKDAANYGQYEHTKVPASKLIPRDVAGSMTQGRPDKSKSFASQEQIAEASETGGNSAEPNMGVNVPARKVVDGPASNPDSLGPTGNPISEKGAKVSGKDHAADAPSYQFSTTNTARTLSVEDPNKGATRKAAEKQGAANDNKTQPNSGCG